MKDSLSDRTADSQTAVSGRDSTSFTNLDGEARSIMSNVDTRSEAEPFSDAEKLVLLTHLYLELRLGVKQALRAADADLLTLFKGRTRRLMVKQPL